MFEESDPFSRNTAPVGAPLVWGSGAQVRDADGRQYIDFCAQTLNANLGQCHPVITAAITEQAGRLTCVSSRFSTATTVELHRELIAISPAPLTKVNLASGTGSMANECAIKAARKKTGRQLVISRDDSHLGQSIETMRVSGKHWSSGFLGQRDARFLPAPTCHSCPFQQKPESCSLECLDGLETLARSEGDRLACVIVEPIMVDAGVLVPPARYHRRVRAFCDEHDIALIWDEVQTAFGWLGTMFAMELFDVVPDLVSLGKGLAAGLPLAATLMRPGYDVLTYGEHETTSGAHPLSTAASLAMIRHLRTSDELAGVRRKAAVLRDGLERLRERHRCIGDVRGVGLLVGLELVDPASGEPATAMTAALFKGLLDEGVITRISKVGRSSNVLQLKPPLVISTAEIEDVLQRMGRCLERVTRA